MTSTARADACVRAAEALRRPPAADAPPLLAGFDGFVDRIVDVVSVRESGSRYTRVPTLSALSARIAQAAGRSANLELVVKETKLGGNGAILAAAAGALGARTVFVGTVGEGGVDPLFAPLAVEGARAFTIGAPGKTDALEFDDGKLLLGEPDPLNAVTWERVRGPLSEALPGSLLAMGNWTMTPGMTAIWRALASELLPSAGCPGVFIDLADPAKRSDEDLLAAIDALRAMNEHAPVTLSLNHAESERAARLVGAVFEETDLVATSESLRARCGLAEIALHTRRRAALASGEGGCALDGPFVRRPRATTGAGDHFNAGLCVGRTLALPPDARLALGVGNSGLFVRTGRSPGRDELAGFLERLPAPE